MGHHGRMHAQPGVGTCSDSPVKSSPGSDQNAGQDAGGGAGQGPETVPKGYLPATNFRSRRSALSNAQRQTWERLWPKLGLDVPPQARRPQDPPPATLDTQAWFGRDAPVVLEIGCGSGTSTLAMAQTEPHIDVIAVEVYRRGLAQLLCSIDRLGSAGTNIRLIRGNAVDVLEKLIAPDSLGGVRVFFPDPWPKARHHKRRLLQPATFALIADRLLPGGVLHAATDHPGYATHIADCGDAESRLIRADPGFEPLPISVVRPTTKYENKAHDEGSPVADLLWKKPG